MCLGGKKKPLKQPKKEKGEMDEVCQQIHKSCIDFGVHCRPNRRRNTFRSTLNINSVGQSGDNHNFAIKYQH